MRLQHPFEIVTPTLDGDVLAVLAGADEWFAVQSINALNPNRSDEGIRKTLKRLVSTGIVEELSAGRSHLYRLNRDHIGAAPLLQLASLKETFYSQIRSLVGSWKIKPLYVALFGSAARGQMEADSDVDLFLIQPDGTSDTLWQEQVNELTERASKWVGSDVRPLLYTESDISRLGRAQPVFEYIADEGIPLFGERILFLNLLRKTV